MPISLWLVEKSQRLTNLDTCLYTCNMYIYACNTCIPIFKSNLNKQIKKMIATNRTQPIKIETFTLEYQIIKLEIKTKIKIKINTEIISLVILKSIYSVYNKIADKN